MALIDIRGVSKSFTTGRVRTDVLRDINLQVEEGELVAIVGFSGTGKTTLISLLAGLLEPDRGEVVVAGEIVRSAGPERALVFQSYALLPWLDVFGNIKLAVDAVFRDWSKAKRREHVLAHIEMVGLARAAGKKPSELSGGMRQRVALARALAMTPRILLLDEPLGALDALTRGTLQTEIARIWELSKKTIVMITNDVDEGILLADRVIPLDPGAEAATLGPAFVIDLPRPRDRAALNHDPRFKELRNGILRHLTDARHRADAGKGGQALPLTESLPSAKASAA